LLRYGLKYVDKFKHVMVVLWCYNFENYLQCSVRSTSLQTPFFYLLPCFMLPNLRAKAKITFS
jgi:hypothetical protein